MPKISIIVPIYKSEKYLSACLDSVLAQTFAEFEVICVNDGSPDNCGAILNEYIQKDNRIRVITQENQGLSMARNNALEQAKGTYIQFLDPDDTICPQLLEICYTLAEKEKAQMVSFKFFRNSDKTLNINSVYELNKLKYVVTDTPLYFQTKRNKHKISVNAWSKLYKKDLIKDLTFIPGIKMEDYPHTYAALLKHPKTVVLDIPLYHYTLNPKSISSEQLDVKMLQDYQVGLNFVIDAYKTASKKEKRFVMYELFPNILKQQLNKILRSPKEKQNELYRAFAIELVDLKQKGWLRLWGHKVSRYLDYKKIIKEYYL